MSLSNPAGLAKDAARGYVQALLDLLGDADPFEVLAAQPARLRHLTAGLSEDELSRPERPGKWSIRHVVQHQADTELVVAFRIRMVLAHERPPLAGFDQDLWANQLGYADVPVAESLEQFEVIRRANLALARRMGPAALDRVGLHAERGEESALHILRLAAGHDHAHARQIERIRVAIGRPA